MDDQLLMCVMDSGAQRPEQLDTLADRQAARFASSRDRLALYVLHHEVRTPVLRVAAVENCADIRMR